VVTTVKFGDSHHVADLGVFVSLGAKEWLSVHHFNGLLGTLFESLKLSKVGLWVDKSSSDSVGVSSDGSNDTQASVISTAHVVEQKVDKKEVSEMVDTLKKKKMSAWLVDMHQKDTNVFVL
jgi:hypothetical protein